MYRIEANSAEELWKNGQPPFWNEITGHLIACVAIHPNKDEFDFAIKNKQSEIEALESEITAP